MSGGAEQEYFADGMVEEIITALSRIRWLFVIARNSSFTYKGQISDRGEAAGLAHIPSPAAERRPDRKSSRCSGFRKGMTLDTTTGVISRNRVTISRASSSRCIWA